MPLLPPGLDFDDILGRFGVILEAFGGAKGSPELKKVVPGSHFLIVFSTVCFGIIFACFA